jgi:hypothetical protein
MSSIWRFTKLILGAISVGILAIIFSYLASGILFIFEEPPRLPEACASWNNTHIMEKSLMLAGILGYLFVKLIACV